MKTLSAIVAMFTLCGCDLADRQKDQLADQRNVISARTVYKSVFDGHEYLHPHVGGIIHSESCTNHMKINTDTFNSFQLTK